MELLQRRKFCREFLNGYNEKLHPQIISKVFEIGLLTLKSKFNKLLFSKEELDEIIKDLSGKQYVEIVPLPPLKKLEKPPLQSKKYIPQKNEGYISTENNNEDYLKTKIISSKKMFETLQNPNFTTQNSAIYPNWWWNNKEEEEYENPNNNNKISPNDEYLDDNNYEDYNYEYENNENEIYRDYNQDNLKNERNYPERLEQENEEIKNKSYAIKKLTMNSGRPIKINNIPYNNKKMKKIKNSQLIPVQLKKKEKNQRVKSTKPPTRKINSFSKNDKTEIPKKKIIKKVTNTSQGKKNDKLTKIPKYKYTYSNGRILRIPEQNKNFINLTMTEPNKY